MTPSVHGEVLTGDVSSLEEDSVVSDDVRSDVKVSCRDVLSLEVLVEPDPRSKRSIVLRDLLD